MGILKKNIRFKSQALTLAALAAAVLILVNVLANKISLRFDLTQDKEYTLSPSTLKILDNLDDHVTIKLFFSSQTPSRIAPILDQVSDLIEEFRIHSKGKIGIERIDPDSSPQNEQETQMLGIPPLQLNVVEKDKAEVRKIYLGVGIFYADKKEILPVVSEPTHLEYDLTASILKLTSTKQPNIGLLNTSSNPEDYSILEEFLGKDLTIQKIQPQDKNWLDKKMDALLVVDPKDLPADTIKQIDFCWDAGIPVIIMASGVSVNANLAAFDNKTGLDDWFKDKGLEFIPHLIIDPKFSGRATFSSGIVQYQVPYPFFINVPQTGLNPNHPITSKLESILLPWSSSFKMDPKVHTDWTFETLVESSQVSFLQEGAPNVTPQALEQMNPGSGEKRPLAVSIQTPDKKKKILAIADAALLKNAFLNDYVGNQIFVQNMVDWSTRGDALINIRSRGKTVRPLVVLDSASMELIRWFHLILTPLLFVVFGLILRRIHRKKLDLLASKING